MRLLSVALFVFVSFSLSAQDTLRISLAQADSLFIQNNLAILAERYRIEASRAFELQDRLWENPNLFVEISAYNGTRGKVLDVGQQGQKIISVQQLVYTASKRNKRVALAAESTRMTEYEFFELIRALKFELRERFFETYFLSHTIQLFDAQMATLQATVAAFEKEYNRNNVALKEVLRLKALLFQITNDRTTIQYELLDNQRELRNILQVEVPISPRIDSAQLRRYRLGTYTSQSLQEKALLSRADLRIAESLARQAELNYSLQKALAVPDLRLGATYDQAGSYINNYLGLSLSTDLPILNRNQGAIRAARSMITYQKTLENAHKASILNEVETALRKVQEADKVFESVEGSFAAQFELLSRGIYDNFQKGNITLLEFIDFIETYNESIKQFNRLQADRIRVYEELNYAVAEELFK
ncbi:cobalt-zinc-cadmium efflux system outer membrane protein [Rhabdobacter roseus]|uniref:Cobalt-zinc-cadmium efflux system outer membrane protein n=1 Tax=Rhabdobacter roseus TaxID=1655419 RepID=A0A840TI52_9BACT|nr:TolC family protein [Rhabdobacter roseus]MBB5283836.1 cobalt-zinc-cadmium efflux system outer membrane protein [Rhabdobacter roseus]